jgi:hypothetical protein
MARQSQKAFIQRGWVLLEPIFTQANEEYQTKRQPSKRLHLKMPLFRGLEWQADVEGLAKLSKLETSRTQQVAEATVG